MADGVLQVKQESRVDAPPELIRLKDLNSVQRLDLERKCADLRRAGHDFLEIGRRLNLSAVDAKKVVNRWLSREDVLEEPFRQKQRNLELYRLETLQQTYWGQAIGEEWRTVTTITGEEVAIKSPCLEAAKFVRELGKDRRELLGLNAPKEFKGDITTHSPIDDELAKLMQKANESPTYPRTIEGTITRSEIQAAVEDASET